MKGAQNGRQILDEFCTQPAGLNRRTVDPLLDRRSTMHSKDATEGQPLEKRVERDDRF